MAASRPPSFLAAIKFWAAVVLVTLKVCTLQLATISQENYKVSKFTETFLSGLGVLLGNGSRILFWSQEWIPGVILKVNFPRIYALAMLKEGKVNDYGYFDNNKWIWNIPLRRDVFDWEIPQWNHFCSLLQNYCICNTIEDKLVWKDSCSGRYTSKYFCWKFLKDNNLSHERWGKVWRGLLPPKVEVFMWQLLKGRVAVKQNLVARNLLSVDNANCVFCRGAIESVSHLFFVCPVSWKIWCHWCWRWGIQWVGSNEPWACFEQWLELLPRKQCDKVWRMSFGAILWSIWLIRNEHIFQNKDIIFEQLVDVIKAIIAHWVVALWPKDHASFMGVFNCLENIVAPKGKVKQRTRQSWLPPSSGSVKFNVDGSSAGKPGPAGIGGVMHDHTGKELACFSKSIGVEDSNIAELLAIREAFLIFIASPFVVGKKLIIESDSQNAVSWVNGLSSAPWRVFNFINHIETLKMQVIDWKVNHMFRELNEVADNLAKEGVYRLSDMIVTCWD
ncbi:hypothetical protein PTKIN_Ptkin17bG0142100 [Pterospermum kingtungense]